MPNETPESAAETNENDSEASSTPFKERDDVASAIREVVAGDSPAAESGAYNLKLAETELVSHLKELAKLNEKLRLVDWVSARDMIAEKMGEDTLVDIPSVIIPSVGPVRASRLVLIQFAADLVDEEKDRSISPRDIDTLIREIRSIIQEGRLSELVSTHRTFGPAIDVFMCKMGRNRSV